MLGLILLPAAMVLAQEKQTPPAEQEKSEAANSRPVRSPHGRRGPRFGRMMRDLNLTEQQKQQLQAIVQGRVEATKAQREELTALREKKRSGTLSEQDEARVQSLRQEIHDSMQGIRDEIRSILTPEQLQGVEKREQERKARRDKRLQSRPQTPPNQ